MLSRVLHFLPSHICATSDTLLHPRVTRLQPRVTLFFLPTLPCSDSLPNTLYSIKAALTHPHEIPVRLTSICHFSEAFDLRQTVIRSLLLAISLERSKSTYEVHVNDLPL
jgi:hypothetical protein